MPRRVADRKAVAVYFNAFTGYRVVLESRTTRILVQEAVISGAYWRPRASHPRRGAGNLFEGEISTKFSRDVGQPFFHSFGRVCVCVCLYLRVSVRRMVLREEKYLVSLRFDRVDSIHLRSYDFDGG